MPLSIKYEVRSIIAQYPELFFPLINLVEKDKSLAVGKDTELVIEGFPGSSNSYAEAIFTASQFRQVKVAHHLHAPAQVVLAVRRRIPVLVLIREPSEAVVSFLSRQHRPTMISLRQALRAYIRFYEFIMPYSDQFVLGLFEDVTNNFSVIVDKLNSKFNLNFSSNIESPNYLKTRYQTKLTENQKELKKELKGKINSPQSLPILSRANKVYKMYVSENTD